MACNCKKKVGHMAPAKPKDMSKVTLPKKEEKPQEEKENK